MILFSPGKSAAQNVFSPIPQMRVRCLSRLVTIIAALATCLVLPAHRATAQGQTSTFTPLVDFDDTDGESPYGSLILGNDGNFYGTTFGGGTNNAAGTVFKMTPTGALTTLYNFPSFFSQNSEGIEPYGGLVQGSDGNFYGTAYAGGSAGQGTVFKITSTGAFTLLATFTGTNGSEPKAALVQGSDGDFYGTTAFGGIGWSSTVSGSGYGTLFKVTPSGTFITLYSFSGKADGAHPDDGLVQGSDGNLYGTTSSGGTGTDRYGNTLGTVFKVTPSGNLTTLYTFTADANVYSPSSPLVQGSDGNFYGTDYAGTMFKVTPSGVLTTLATLDATSLGGVIQGSDGDFYGTTVNGGANGYGNIFQVTPSGILTSLYSFSTPLVGSYGTNTDGANPFAGLVQGKDGNLYGTAVDGGQGDGTYGFGTVFKLALPGTASPTAITSISPATLQGGNLPFTLTLTGTSFSHGVTADFNGTVLTPAFAASTKLTFNVPASLVAIPGSFNITVTDPGAAPSNGLPFTITPGLTLARVSPVTAPAGSGPISITVTGANFVNGCVVKWNGQPLPTYYLSPTAATATVPASYLATAGTAKITISNPHVYATQPVTFAVTAH